MTQPQVLKGFRDVLPAQKRARDFVLRKLTTVFEQYGFDPIETPTLEYKDTIMGKYGAEADKLVYTFSDRGEREVALRYDQTVPTARFIANNLNDLPMPFRRYQTQNVFRADKPQKGRYREFTQCDIDIFGSMDPIADAEILVCTYAAYSAVGFTNLQIRVNDRRMLVATVEPYATNQVSVFSIIQSIDKLDKISPEDVTRELMNKGLSNVQAVNVLKDLDSIQPSANLEQIMSLAVQLGVPTEVLEFTPSLARGLDYYTGMIFEVCIPEFSAGSVCGGGRYDNLIGQLAGIDMPAVGMAVGFDRTVEAAEELKLVPIEDVTRLLVTVFDQTLLNESAEVAKVLRDRQLVVELYPKVDKLAKQFKYADKKGIRYAVVIGPQEKENGLVILKDLLTGKQQQITLDQLEI